MRIRTALFSLFIMLIFGLVACAEDNVATAVSYLGALNEGDLDQAASLACAERADEIVDSLMSVEPEEQASVEFQRVSCSQQASDEVACQFTIVQEETDINNEGTFFEQERNVVFNIEDGRICGFHEQVAN